MFTLLLLTCTTFMSISPYKKNARHLKSTNSNRHPCSLRCTFLFAIIFAITWWTFFSAISPWTTLLKVLGICPEFFILWLVFFELVLWFSQALKFFNYGILITTTMMTFIWVLIFATQRLVILVFSLKKTS